MSGERERAEAALNDVTQENKSRHWRPVAQDLARDVLALLLELQALREEIETLRAERDDWRIRADERRIVIDELRGKLDRAWERVGEIDSARAATEERVVAMERIEKAARKLDEALSEEYSRFDSDGVYERYFRFRGEEELRTALKEARK